MATDLGQAYVQIMPSAKGISGSISKLVDPEATSAGNSAGENIGAGLVSKLKIILAAAGIGKIISSAVTAGGELEQNLGGTEAVFGGFADTIKTSAQEAYKNMGLSATDYMGTANKMGSLFQGSGMTQQQSLDMTSAAMQRAADVASVMGVDTSVAMESIAGAAKNNFTMMDNLGVSMNATSLQAYALEKGINFDWNTATQAEKSELAMKMFMDRTSQYAGNFAKESEQTFSGSLGAMKSSFTNVLAALSTGEGLAPALSGMTTSILNFADNLLPMIGNVVTQIPGLIVQVLAQSGPPLVAAGIKAITDMATGLSQSLPLLIPQALQAILTIVDTIITNIPLLITAGLDIITALAQGFMTAIPILIAKIPEIISSIITILLENIPVIIQTGVDLISSLVTGLPEIITTILTAIPQIISQLVTAVMDNIPYIIQSGIDLLTSLVTGLPEIVTAISAALPEIIGGIVDTLIANIPMIIQTGVELLTSLIEDLPTVINSIVSVLPEIIDGITTTLTDNIPAIIAMGVELLQALVEDLPVIIDAIAAAMPEIITGITEALTACIPEIIQCGVSLLVALIENMPEILSTLVGAMPEIITSMVDALAAGLTSFEGMGKDLLLGLRDGIVGAVGDVISAAIDAVGDIVDNVKKFFGIASPSKVFIKIGKYLDQGLAKGISDNTGPITKAMDKVNDLTARSFESDIAFNTTGNTQLLTRSMTSGIASDAAKRETIESRMLAVLEKYLPVMAEKDQRILLDGNALVGGIYGRIDEMVAFKQREQELAYGG